MIRIPRMIAIALPLLAGCSSQYSVDSHSPSATDTVSTDSVHVVFLTRDGCSNTPVLLANLKTVAKSFGQPLDYDIVNQGTLPATDARVGYATPTILYDDRDLFGLPIPKPPFPPPS